MALSEGEARKDRRRAYYVGVVAVVALFSIFGNFILTGLLIKTSNDNHASLVKLDNQLSKKDNKITSLEKQHGADILNESQLLQNINKADKELNQIGVDLFLDAAAACANTVSIANQLHLTITPCPTISPLPELPASPTPTIPTTTTVPPVARSGPAQPRTTPAPVVSAPTSPTVTHGHRGHHNH